ncbi:unnamed protein product [Rotaria magnacalcarata]|uniref:Uncharacterized protein n=2 Tax=Rotaria magnacalcarata TaxID=392030 RepID=A0A816E4Y6_9BILA|nr:unnamed protein product [Rotaria magnacalcarata]
MSIFEQASSRPGSRFGKLSSNMFFTRNTAKPKRVRHIEGLNGALICNVNDDVSVDNMPRSSSLNFNRTNLPAFETSRRTERLVPPTGFWNTHGIIHDTDRWKQELAALASASGIGLEKDDYKLLNKSQTAAADQQHASRSGAHYSTRTGRFNEGTSTSRGRTGSKHGTAYSDTLFSVPENEREMWMLQVLCQLLGTSQLEDVQSWLVSAAPAEKEQARTMINAALRGLKESERTVDPTAQSVDFNSLSNFVEKQQNEEKHVSQKFIQDTLNRSAPVLPSIDEEQHANMGLNGGLGYAENNNEHLKSSAHSKTTYGRAYHNFNQRSFSSFDSGSPKKNNDSFNENEEEVDNNEEQIDTIHLDDDRQRPQSGLLLKAKVQTNKSQSLVERPPSSHKKKHRVESVEFTDNDNDNNNTLLHNKNDNDDDNQQQDLVASSHKVKPSLSQDDQRKVRKIRDLQNKLSRQEEEAKKKFNELQSKQSRLENAIKLLAKQTSSFKKRRQHKTEHVEDLDAPVVNVIIQSPRETDPRDKSQETISLGKQLALSTLPSNEKSKNSRNGNNNTKIGDYTIQDVKVQISLSRLDNHPAKVFSGVWKPDASTLHRLQGN